MFNNLKPNSFQLSKKLNLKVNDENYKIKNYSNNKNLYDTYDAFGDYSNEEEDHDSYTNQYNFCN